MENNMKIVSFEECRRCTHWELDEYDDPCYECLQNPTNYASRRPLYFEEDPSKKTRSGRRRKKGSNTNV